MLITISRSCKSTMTWTFIPCSRCLPECRSARCRQATSAPTSRQPGAPRRDLIGEISTVRPSTSARKPGHPGRVVPGGGCTDLEIIPNSSKVIFRRNQHKYNRTAETISNADGLPTLGFQPGNASSTSLTTNSAARILNPADGTLGPALLAFVAF